MIQKLLKVKNLYTISGGIFDKNKIQSKLDTIEDISSKEDFWKDQNKVKTLLKEKKFYQDIISSHAFISKELNNLIDLYKLGQEEKNEEENLKLQQKIGWLSLIAGLGPMMGLFGTVWGMVGAFAKISSAGAGGVNPSDFAGTISLALMTTVLGLVVAIPTTAFYALFRNKVAMMGLEIGTITEDLFERFRTKS